MLASKIIRNIAPKFGTQLRTASSLPSFLYNNVWRKSSVVYITYVLTGVVVIESVYGSVTDWIWDKANEGVRKYYFY